MVQITYRYITTCFFLAFCFSALGNSPSKMLLQLNKGCYVSGETIKFKNTIINSNNQKENVLYADLCGDAALYSSAHILRKNNHWEGELYIPDSLETGVYMVRAYIGSPDGSPNIVAQLITVLNRFGENKENESKKSQSTYKPFFCSFEKPSVIRSGLKCSTNKTCYAPTENIILSIENGIANTISGLSIEVVKEGAFLETLEIYNGQTHIHSNQIKIYNGLTLCGKLTDKNTFESASNEVVFLSFPDSIPGINYATTNSKGEFIFTIEDYFEEHTAIVQTMNPNKQFDITLFPMSLLPPAAIPYYVPTETEESDFAILAIKRASFTKAYSKVEIAKYPTNKGFRYPFYGTTSNVVYPNIYVDLVDFEEISKEILPLVYYKCTKEECNLKIFDPNSGMFHLSPWLIVDGVPISNLASIKKLNTLDVKRVEVQSNIRAYGNLLIGGSLAVFTHKGNLSGIDMPPNAVRKKLNTYQEPVEEKNTNELYFNDVLCWKPSIEKPSKRMQIDVKSSYETGKYYVVVQGVDSNGELNRAVSVITIE